MLKNNTSESRKESIVHMLESDGPSVNKANSTGIIPMQRTFMIFLVVTILGILSGFGASLVTRGSAGTTPSQSESGKPVKEKAGIADKKTFKDSAEGILKPGGIEGEGEYHLERPGGPSQNVYLTSTTVDLSEYIDKKVKVMGETFSAEKAGWFMDVGFIELAQ